MYSSTKTKVKISDLRINDWIQTSTGYKQITHLSILGGPIIGCLTPFASCEEFFSDNIVFNEKNYYQRINEIKRIPITEKILQDFGFVWSDNSDQYSTCHGYWVYEDLELLSFDLTKETKVPIAAYVTDKNVHIDYVDELQHLMRFMGYGKQADSVILFKNDEEI